MTQAAEKWRNGLASALVALSGIAVLQAQLGAKDIEDDWAIAARVILLVCVLLVGVALSLSMLVSFGRIARVKVPSTLAEKRRYEYEAKRATYRRLRLVPWLSCGALLCVALFSITLLSAPRASAANLQIVDRTGFSTCGEMRETTAGSVQIKPAGGPPIRIYLGDISTIRVVSKC
jgi:hypothetical protein